METSSIQLPVNGLKDTEDQAVQNTETWPLCIALDRASFNQGKNAQYQFQISTDVAQTLVAKGPGGVLDLRFDRPRRLLGDE